MLTYFLSIFIVVFTVAAPIAALAQETQTESETQNTPPEIIQVTITDGPFSSTITTDQTTVSEVLAQAGIELEENEFTSINEEKLISENIDITIRTPIPVSLVADGTEKKPESKAQTVSEFLTEQGISLSGEDYVEPGLETALSSDAKVEVIRKQTKKETVTERITFKTEKQNDASLLKGEARVITAGVEGSKEVTYSIVYENGEEVSRKALETNVTTEATNKVVAVGTKEPEPVITSNTSGETKSGVVTFYYGPTNAASHIYPKGSVLQITNTDNGKSITVTIDDYGGFGNRLVDLRKDHFLKLGELSRGLLPVTVTRIR